MKSFESLSLSKAMLHNLKKLNYTSMTDVQEATISHILKKRDVLAQAKTGSGKTAAFGIGMLENINIKSYRIQGMVLCPTRELAAQVAGELRRIARFQHNLKILTLTGGTPMYHQELSLKHEAHLVVGTPGRVQKLLRRNKLILDHVSMIVLDEADKMLEMGFFDVITDIITYAPRKRQTLCFSATFPAGVRKLCQQTLINPIEVTVESHHDESVISQHFFEIPEKEKCKATIEILAKYQPDSTIVFCNTKDQCRRVRRELDKAGLHSIELHGDLEQKDRTVALVRFSNGSSKVLVATDVAARGLDIDDLSAVINFDMPFEPETYVHRIGRTGRAGREGLAFSLMQPGEDFRLEQINTHSSSSHKPEEFSYTDSTQNVSLEPDMVTLSINGGRRQKISAGDILGALTKSGGINGSHVGSIDRMDNLTFVAIKRVSAHKALKAFQSQTIKGRRFMAMLND